MKRKNDADHCPQDSNLPKDVNHFYLNWFWTSLQKQTLDSPMMISLFPDLKTVTVSAAALFGMSFILGMKDLAELKDSHVIVVGDGHTCRTGALFGVWSKWVTSVDPCLNVMKCVNRPSNVDIAKMTIQDWIKDWNADGIDSLAIVSVHAHVALQDYLGDLLRKCGNVPKIGLVTIECCVPQFLETNECETLGFKLVDDGINLGIHSQGNHVKAWVKR